MIRKFIAALAVSAAALILTAIPAAAAPYPPSENLVGTTIIVSGTSQAIATTKAHPSKPTKESSAIAVLPTSSSVESTAAGSLSYTGISFNVPLTLTIAALVVLGGFALVFFGGRGLSRTRRQH